MSELNTIREAIDAIATGKFVVVVDDEDRENEGDLIIAPIQSPPKIWLSWSNIQAELYAALLQMNERTLFTYHLWLQTIPKPWEQLSQFL